MADTIDSKSIVRNGRMGSSPITSIVRYEMPSLRRVSDGAGDFGPMSMAIYIKDGDVIVEHDSKPKVGAQIRVGSYKSRSYENQDWWQTTDIKEIIEERSNYVKFRTTNSIYEWSV